MDDKTLAKLSVSIGDKVALDMAGHLGESRAHGVVRGIYAPGTAIVKITTGKYKGRETVAYFGMLQKLDNDQGIS
jgi:hypothetical protein